MGNLFVNVPVPASNGSGAPVDTSAFGLSKTISVAGPFIAAVTIEISNELAPTKWAPLITFNNPDGIVLEAACRWMRASVAGYRGGTPACDVGGSDDGALFANLPATPGNGAGLAVDVSALPLFKTVTVGGPFSGTVQIEVSEDGITAWSQLGFGFTNPGHQSLKMTARFMRVVRAGVTIAAGLPIVNVGACNDGSDAPLASVAPKLFTVYVGKNGVDVTADGSISKPFLTVQAAMDFAYTTYVVPAEPQPTSPFTRPCVFVNAGTYDDGPLVLPPQICVMGEGFNHTRIVGNWTIDARWSNLLAASDFRSGWMNVGIAGSVTVDFEAFSSFEGKLYAFGTRFFSPIVVSQNLSTPINTFECKACDFFGDITLNGIETTLSASTTYDDVTITLNQVDGPGADNKFVSSGGSLGNIVINSPSEGPPPYNCTFSHLAQPNATLTLDGSSSNVKAVLGAVPLQSLVILLNASNLNQVFRINQLNWASDDRPAGPYTGQQYFDTDIARPIWWDGAVWVPLPNSANGRFDPNVGVDVTVTAQSGQFVSPGAYGAVGVYTIHLVPIPGVVSGNNVFWIGTAFTAGNIVTIQPGFSVDHAVATVRIVTNLGVPVDDSFHLHADINV